MALRPSFGTGDGSRHWSPAPVNLPEDSDIGHSYQTRSAAGTLAVESICSAPEGGRLCVCRGWACIWLSICTNPPLPVSGQAAVE